MCVEAGPPPSPRITRRGVLAGAAVLAGTAGLMACSPRSGPAKAEEDTSAPAGGNLVVDGGTLIDPETGAVTEDAVVAIRTATTNAATLLGLEKTVGRLQPGFSGDVLVLPGDPLNDISVLKKPVRVVRAGVTV